MLGITLKPLWHFKNAMQISAYLRHVAYLPANVHKILKSMNDAATFKPVHDWVFDTGVTKVYKHKDEISKQQDLARWDIDNRNLFWSFGIFALAFIVLGILFGLILLFRFLRQKFSYLSYAEDYLIKKLFFGSIIRYMIESYLKIFHNSIFFF